MKLQVSFNAPILPRRYHFLFTSLIKSALEVSAPELKNNMYQYGVKSNKIPKPFTGSVYLQTYQMEEDGFQIDGEVKLIISSPSAEFLIHVYNGFIQKTNYKYKEYELDVNHVKILTEKLPTKEKIILKTLSPIALKDKSGRFLSVEDPNYEKELVYISNEVVKAVVGRELNRPLKFTPIAMQKTIVQLQHDSFRKLNNKSILFVESYKGLFLLEGHNEDLTILTQAGLGHRRAQLFGAVELVDE